MKFLILRVLTHSELGMFHEYRRSGREGSKQRAVNFDGDVVDRVFPAALDTDRIDMSLRFDTDQGVRIKDHWLTRQAKNWRLEGNCPRDQLYSFVTPGCLFAMEVDSGTNPATGSWVVFPADHVVTHRILAHGEAAGLTRAGMIALHGDEGAQIRNLLASERRDMFNADEDRAKKMSQTIEAVEGGKHLPPDPRRLAQIIAGTGHTLPTAIADIVDNAISADATEIRIRFSPPNSGHGRWLSISDNGHGMSADELGEAMRLGSLSEYDSNSLGKFGYGLKGASWSQARVFTVVTRRRGQEPSHLSWDRDNLRDWIASNAPLEEWEKAATALGEQGTVVLWKDMKPPAAGPSVPGVAPWSAEIMELGRHLGLVFHRFLEGEAKNRKKVTIWINDSPVRHNNPIGHTLVQPYDLKPIRIPTAAGDDTVMVQPFVLPSEEEIKAHHKAEGPQAVNDELERISMFGKRNETQGLYVYRNDRLIAWGGWYQMWSTNDEKTKLARVTVSFGTKLDETFDVNITKRSVRLPPFLQAEIKKLADPARTASKAKYKKAPATQPKPRQAPSPTPLARPAAPIQVPPPIGGPPSGEPRLLPNVPPAPAGPVAPPVRYRSVTTDSFAWKLGGNLTGGRDLQVSRKLPELAALADRLADDPDGLDELAAFLRLLDAKGLQGMLLNESED